MQIGAQFYTLREHCKTLEGLAESLKKVADMGYRTVQLSATCPFDAQWMKEQLDQNDLKCVLTHTPVPRLQNETVRVAQEHAIFGCDCVGLGYYGFKPEKGESVAHFLETYGPIAKTFRENGKYFMYHNHAHEFAKEDGKLRLEHLIENIPAEDMGVTLDTYWVQVGGADPAQWLEKLAGRIPCIHLKDCAYGQQMAVVGEGNINFDRVFEKAEAGGTQYMLVEQDDCHGEDPFECLRRSYEYLRACGFN